jgi:hypothetical protein
MYSRLDLPSRPRLTAVQVRRNQPGFAELVMSKPVDLFRIWLPWGQAAA